MPQVFCHILTWNDRKYLPDLLESIARQTYRDFTVRMLDNGSTDDTPDYLYEHVPHALVARNTKNNGFAGGHNQLFDFTIAHLGEANPADVFILVANSDMIWQPTVVEKLVEVLEANPELGAVQPKIYRAFGEHAGDEALEETMKSDILDTTGLAVHAGWRMADRGAGELDAGQYDDQKMIFGATGTMSLFRLSALLDVMIDGEIFDGEFFAYREDCDLAWRMARAGWKSEFVPSAIAYHYRGMFGEEKQSLWKRLKNRRGQRPFFAALSTRNQVLMLIKNLSLSELILSSPWIVFGEGGRLLYGFLFESMTRKRILEIPGLVRKMRKKRKQIFAKREVPDKVLRAYVD